MLSSGDAKVVDRLISILIGIVVFIFVKEALEAWKDSSNGKGKKPEPSMENLFGTYVPNSDQSATVWEKTVAWLLQVSKQFGGNLAPLIAVSQEAATSVGGGIQQGASNLNPVTALVNALFGSKADPTSDINNDLQAYALSQEQAEWATQFVEGVPQSVLPDHF